VASGPLVVLLLIQRAGVSAGASNWSSSITWIVWLPLLAFEPGLAAWLIVKGVADSGRKQLV
jgi:hypothetical protein